MDSDPLHTHTSKPRPREHHGGRAIALLIPSLVFVSVLGFYLHLTNNYSFENQSFASARDLINKSEKFSITVGGTQVIVTTADSDPERSQGLSRVTNLPEQEGKLFTFDHPDIRNPFWMKDMIIPIDIIWINDGAIAQIHKNIKAPGPGTPDSELMLYVPDSPYDYVLEVNAGYSDQNGWGPGTPVDLSTVL